MKTRLIRKEYNETSIFHINCEYVTDVFDICGDNLKFHYNQMNGVLTIFGDHLGIYVHYE